MPSLHITKIGCFRTNQILKHHELSKVGRNSTTKHEVLKDFKDDPIVTEENACL
jgi:hypothetical protein